MMNERQKEIAEHLEHPLLVDAGPGTGKTATVVQRYMNLIEGGANPRKVLMVTFTNNAAQEMRGRIRSTMTKRIRVTDKIARGEPLDPEEDKDVVPLDEKGLLAFTQALNEVRASTFDSLCLRIVLDAPEFVSQFFGFKDVTLTRNARLSQNETLNRDHFRRFYTSFIDRYGHLYVKKDQSGNTIEDIPSLLSGSVDDIFDMINRLMSTGIIPVADGDWFSDGLSRLRGQEGMMYTKLRAANESDAIHKKLAKYLETGIIDDPQFSDEIHRLHGIKKGPHLYSEEFIDNLVDGDRDLLLHFLNHVYYEYIRKSVSDNRLTFGLAALFAFCILYTDERSRSLYSVEHLIVDEFQDTNAMQVKVCLMLLERDNICVVGDWKQGIYGFRFASIDNITEFQQRVRASSHELNSDGTARVTMGRDIDVSVIPLEENYRSHSTILDWAFAALEADGSPSEGSPDVIPLTAKKDEVFQENSGFGMYVAKDKEDEYEAIVNKVSEYVGSGNYLIKDDDTFRQPRYGDIAILFQTVKDCVCVYDRLRAAGIPAFLQSDMEIMSSLPGKLALAWLRFVNDKDDRRGISTILVHEGYSLSQIKGMFSEVNNGHDILDAIPRYLAQERAFLAAKRKRPNDLLTSIFAFHRIGDNDEHSDAAQAIIAAISSSFNSSLMTISDMIRLIEDDIENGTKYPIDAVLGKDAVIVQTMHKSKGLEYPIVIVSGVGSMPKKEHHDSVLHYDPVFGLRSDIMFVNRGDDRIGRVKDWKYSAISVCKTSDHSEECRLLFVAMSRAEQYMYLTGKAGKRTSKFLKHFIERYSGIHGDTDPKPERYELPKDVMSAMDAEPPTIPEYSTRRRGLDVHSLITYVPAEPGSSEHDGGKEYGNAVHFIADKLVKRRRDDLDARVLAEAYAGDKGMDYDQLCQDAIRINHLLDGFGDATLISEVPCSLPVGDTMIHGIIDLIVDDGDTISIYDHKTESDLRNMQEYRVQVSIYAHSVMQARGKDNVKAYLHYVTKGDAPIQVDIMSMGEIEGRLERYKRETSQVPEADYT